MLPFFLFYATGEFQQCKTRDSSTLCRPLADVHVATGPGKIDVTTYGASVEVSDKLKGLGLQDRYSSIIQLERNLMMVPEGGIQSKACKPMSSNAPEALLHIITHFVCRYSVDAAVSIRSTSDYKLHTSAVLTLAVDIPPMFRLTPKAMIQVTGTAVLSNVVSVLMEDYVKTMVRDIEELASVPAAPINLLENK